MREFHLHTRVEGDLKQAILVCLTRDKINHTLEIHEICVIINNGIAESKMSINMTNLTDVMALHENGNIDSTILPSIKNAFYDMLTPESKETLDVQEVMLDIQKLSDVEQLIVASDVATSVHPSNQSIEDIVNEKLQNIKRSE